VGRGLLGCVAVMTAVAFFPGSGCAGTGAGSSPFFFPGSRVGVPVLPEADPKVNLVCAGVALGCLFSTPFLFLVRRRSRGFPHTPSPPAAGTVCSLPPFPFQIGFFLNVVLLWNTQTASRISSLGTLSMSDERPPSKPTYERSAAE